MKKILLIVCAVAMSLCVMSQGRPMTPKTTNLHYKVALPPNRSMDESVVGEKLVSPYAPFKATLDDPIIGDTWYDKQSNRSCTNRLVWYPDNTVGGVWTYSDQPANYTDRGTGYNYYNGTAWGPIPTARIESGNNRTGWPSYSDFGADGEIVVAHKNATSPLIINIRNTKGTGAWTQTELYGPSGASGIEWPRVVTNGPDNTYIHLICVTGPTANGGVVYQGMDGALLYTRSLDGGTTWDDWSILDGMTSAEYTGISADVYAWAEPVGNTLAFTVGDDWLDQFLMKSTDNGENWTKTMIWKCPYTNYNGPDSTEVFACSEGWCDVAMDNTGKAHVVFGRQRAQYNTDPPPAGKVWYPFTDGLVYWNEDMPELIQSLDLDSLYDRGQLIGWVQDTMIWYAQTTELAHYYNSLSSMPSITIDDNNNIFVVWSSVLDLRDASNFMLRHLYERASVDGGQTWSDSIYNLNSNFLWDWSECVFPVLSKTSNDRIHLIFQEDTDAGIFLNAPDAQGQQSATENHIYYMNPLKDDIVGIKNNGSNERKALNVAPIFPNPCTDNTNVKIFLLKPSKPKVEVRNATGQKVFEKQLPDVGAGNHYFNIALPKLPTGIYLFSVTTATSTHSQKMIVQ